jgi:hypothetical protein
MSGAVAQPPATAQQLAPVCTSVTVPVTLDVVVPATVHGTLCRPAGAPGAGPVQLLLSGATYSSLYWSGEGLTAYSYVAAAVAAGNTTLAIDPIGAGQSTRPLSALVTATSQADAVHQVITALRHGGVDGQLHDHVELVGHSLGSMESLVEASTFGDVSALVLTGYAHMISLPSLVQAFTAALRPADLAGFPTLDPGWLTTAPGSRAALFDNPADVDPAVVAADEAHRDTVSATAVPDGFATVLTPLASEALTGIPVLEVDGGADSIFCGPLTPGCASATALYARELGAFPNTTLATVVVPDAGHSLALARDGGMAAQAIQRWLSTSLDGHPASGPLPEGG